MQKKGTCLAATLNIILLLLLMVEARPDALASVKEARLDSRGDLSTDMCCLADAVRDNARCSGTVPGVVSWLKHAKYVG